MLPKTSVIGLTLCIQNPEFLLNCTYLEPNPSPLLESVL